MRPGMLSKTVFSPIRCQKKPPPPLIMKIMMTESVMARIDTMPILSSAQASERVRGIGCSSTKETS